MAWAEHTPDTVDLHALRAAAQRAEPVALAREQVLPVLSGLEHVVAGPGLRRGTTVAVTGRVGVESVTMALVAGASRQGSWSAVVGLPSLGLVAAGQLGVALDRLAVIDAPPPASWGAVVAALVDGFDLVLCDVRSGRRGQRVPVRQAQRLEARARERGAVLLLVGNDSGHGWPTTADVEIRVTEAAWQGLGDGHGYLRARTLVLEATGRRGAVRSRHVEVQLPDADGGCSVSAPEPHGGEMNVTDGETAPVAVGDRRLRIVAP